MRPESASPIGWIVGALLLGGPASGSARNVAMGGGERPATALEVLHRALYGAPADVPLADLLATPAEYEGKAVKTRGRFGRSADRGYGLSAAGGTIRLEPEAALAARVRARSAGWEGKQVELTGVFFREVGRIVDGRADEPRFLLRFWGVSPPPARSEASATGGTPVTLEQLVYGRGPGGGKRVRVLGKFRGRNLYGDLPWPTRRSDSDWVIKDDFFAVWVTGKGPDGEGFRLDPQSQADTESWVEVVGRYETKSGVTYLRAESVSLADVSFGAVVARAPTLGLSSQRPPAVVFTLPVQGDRLTPTAPIVVQFNKHMDEMSFAGRVRLRYADENDALTGLRLLYEDTNRALVVDPGEPLASGRELVLELLEGIVDVDGQALTPGATPAAAGVVETVRYRVGS